MVRAVLMKLGGWLLGAAVVAGLAALSSVLPLTYACAHWWSKSDFTCVSLEILNIWQTYVSGLLALGAAFATIAYVRFQMDQSEKHRQDDYRRQDEAVAATLTADLLDTAMRIKYVTLASELDPPMSATARTMVVEAAKISPSLAIALHQHCSEVGKFESELKTRSPEAAGRYMTLMESRKPLAYRAQVLAHMFSVAAAQIQLKQGVLGPFITNSDFASIIEAYDVQEADRGYIAHVITTTGIDHA